MIEGIGRVLDNEATKEEIYFTISSAVIMKFTRHAEYTPLHYPSLEERIWCICTKEGAGAGTKSRDSAIHIEDRVVYLWRFDADLDIPSLEALE
jgi:hypothetical protein